MLHRGPKIGASIKLVSQKDGRDLDPQGTKFQPRGEGGPPAQGGRRPVGAQAGATAGDQVALLCIMQPNKLIAAGCQQYQTPCPL